MEYRVTLVDAPPDSPFRDPEEFETWEKALEHILFLATRAERRWSAMALESRRMVPVQGLIWRDAGWELTGYASREAIDSETAKSASASEPGEQTRSRIWRLLRRGRAKAAKDWN